MSGNIMVNKYFTVLRKHMQRSEGNQKYFNHHSKHENKNSHRKTYSVFFFFLDFVFLLNLVFKFLI